MGTYADMMIEAEINGGVTDDGIIVDTETGEVLGFEDDENPRRSKEQTLKAADGYMDGKIAHLERQGFKVKKFSPYHILVNDILNVYHGKKGTSTQIIGGKIVHGTHRSQGIINMVHRFFRYDPKYHSQSSK